jgi:hypothetical protein
MAYEDIVEVLKGCYRDHQLAVEYCCQLSGESLHQFATAIGELAHEVLVRLPKHFI